MAVYELLHGNAVRLDVTVTDADGAPVDPVDILLRIQRPGLAGYVESPDALTVQTDALTGKAWCIYRPDVVGVHAYRWWFPDFPGGAVEGLFRVRQSILTEEAD